MLVVSFALCLTAVAGGICYRKKLLWSGDSSFVCLVFAELLGSVLRVLCLILASSDTCIFAPRAFLRQSG